MKKLIVEGIMVIGCAIGYSFSIESHCIVAVVIFLLVTILSSIHFAFAIADYINNKP